MNAKYRNQLPQLDADIFLTDGGMETTLIFHDGLDLPLFAAFDLLKNETGRAAHRKYFSTYAAIAKENQVGIVLETATWRASKDWGKQLGYTPDEIKQFNLQSVDMLQAIRSEFETEDSRIVISGCIGPHGDGYNPTEMLTADEAEHYHAEQIKTFHESDADMVAALTMTYPDEAIGLTRAAKTLNMPIVISFTLETDGNLPNGQTLQAAIEAVDTATNNYPAYYMINCAHPTHFDNVLAGNEAWASRIRGLRANASTKSHAELNESETLDDGNPVELGQQYHTLRQRLPHLTVLGGCCGTDHRHIEAICKANKYPV
jgi:S-methylmethionine-dependent homocysteine/selenocysteine methylase